MNGDSFLPTRESFAEELVAAGFSDNGERLRGELGWTTLTGQARKTRVQITFGEAFPFAPPTVNLVGDPGVDVTFHVDRPAEGADRVLSGNLCLWERNHPVEQAPWLDVAAFLARVGGWLVMTEAGWPDDEACDLQRYLPPCAELVLFDSDDTSKRNRVAVRVQRTGAPATVRLTNDVVRVGRSLRKQERRKDVGGCWIEDVGELTKPIGSWQDLLGIVADSSKLIRLANLGAVRYVHLRYTRSGKPGVLVVRLRGLVIEACQCADDSPGGRSLRAGPQAGSLAGASVAIVGCGAIGSFAADLLYRSGVREFTLYDADTLLPGNVVRHVGTLDEVGFLKVDVVRDQLGRLGADKASVVVHPYQVGTLTLARRLVASHDLVLDATADARATSLFAVAAGDQEASSGDCSVISACIQRQGQVIRVDRLSIGAEEAHLPPLERDAGENLLEDPGCGSPVSMTPPASVLRAATLVVEVAVLEFQEKGSAPATTVDVLVAQPESPYQVTGRVTSLTDKEPS
jgi:molybdopterin/thiamine biosynthesis adenylyltransferase